MEVDFDNHNVIANATVPIHNTMANRATLPLGPRFGCIALAQAQTPRGLSKIFNHEQYEDFVQADGNNVRCGKVVRVGLR